MHFAAGTSMIDRDVRDQSSFASTPWSVWTVRLVAILLAATAVSLGLLWIGQFYRGENVNVLISFPASDPPWLPTHNTAVPILGVHYFGDFQLPYNWGLNVRDSLSPYLSSAIPSNFPPLLILLYVPFTLLSIKTATFIFLALSAAIVIVPLWLLLSPLKFSYRCIMLVPIVLMTTPFITMLDRGNSIGIGIGLVSWSAVAYRSRRWLWCGIFLAVGSAFTVFPVLLLVIPLALRRYRFATFVFSCAVLLNLLALLCIPGGYIENFRTVVPAMSSGALASGSLLTTWSLYSLVPKMADLLLGPSHIGHLLDPSRFWSWLPAVLYLVLVFLIIRFRRVPQWCWGALSLGSIQLVLPFSAAYTTGWACLAAIWFARGSLMNMELCHSDERPAFHDDMILRVIVLLALVVTLVPSSISIAGVGGSSVLATYLLSPALLLATLCLALVRTVHPRTELERSLVQDDFLPSPPIPLVR